LGEFVNFTDVTLVLKGKENGLVGIIDVTTGGTGYTTAPISFSGGGGSGAAATATITDGIITAITITNQGSAYTSNPAVIIGGDGAGAITVSHIDSVDLSRVFTVIEYKETVPQSIKVTLPVAFGEFLTRGTRILKFDKLYFQYTGPDGNLVKDVFHVRNINRSRSTAKNKQLILTCPHETSELWKRTVSLVAKRTSGFEALNQIIAQLNLTTNKGIGDPLVDITTPFDKVNKLGNNLDPTTNSNHIFESVKLQQAIDEIAKKEGQPTETGGSFEPPYIRFVSKYDHTTNAGLGVVELQAFAQGFKENSGDFTNVPSVTLFQDNDPNSTTTNVLTRVTDEDPETATNLLLFGNRAAGDWLGNWTKFQGARDVFLSARIWVTATDYKKGALVIDAGITYEATENHISSGANQPPSSSWIARTFTQPTAWATSQVIGIDDLRINNDIAYKAIQAHTSSSSDEPPNDLFWIRVNFVPAIDYSPLTKQKVQYWINALAGAKHAATNNGQTQIIDPNVFVEDQFHPRTMVKYVNKDPSLIPAELLVNGNIPDAFRMLAIDPATGIATGEGDFTGNDSNGLPFAGNIVEFFDADLDGVGEWKVFKATIANQDQEVLDWFEGIPWVREPCEGLLSYVDSVGVCTLGSRNANWVIGSYALVEIPFVGRLGRFVANRQFECAHSVKFDSGNNRVDMGNKKILDIDTDSNSAIFIKTAPTIIPGGIDQNPFFIGFNFWSMWPVSSNAIPFGAVTAGEIVSLPTFDFNNMFRTPQGDSEWFGPNVETYFPIQSFANWMQLNTTCSIL